MRVIFTLIFCCGAFLSDAQNATHMIRLDQIGFYVHAPKIAVVLNSTTSARFYVIGEKNKDTMFTGLLSEIRYSKNSSLQTRIADFSALTKTGSFKITSDGHSSGVFEIEEKVHHDLAVASLKAFYFQRASMPLEPVYAGKWSRAEGHPDTIVLVHESAVSANRKAGFKISSPGGWYDAGDYNKYVVNSGITMGTLFSAYEDFNLYFDTLRTNIPALNTSIPDILDEALYNLRWMLTMQDPDDGGVYHKCTNASFDAMIMPAAATAVRYVVQKGTAASLDFAAVTAQASRIFAKFNKQLPGLSDSCRSASEKAWNWAMAHDSMPYDQDKINALYEPKIVTGAYGDNHFSDEWFWAASELFVTTGDKKYKSLIEKYILQDFGLPTWSNTGLLGYYSLLRYRSTNGLPKENEIMQGKLIRMADAYLKGIHQSAFNTVMGSKKTDFNWGSNSNAANQGILPINVYLITRQREYLDAALANLEYLIGRNATGFCFITGFGIISPKHPHHRPSVADGIDEPVPGLLAGGPNPGEQDHCIYLFHEPETAYLDADCSYASNEIAINWNAPLVYLANAVEALAPGIF